MNPNIISKMIKASGVSEGELILIHFWGDDDQKEIANHFLAEVARLGATPVLLQQSRTINKNIFANVKESCFNEQYFELFSKFDGILDVFAYQPVMLGYSLPEEEMALYRKYMSKLFNKLMDCKRFTQIRIPTEANAEECGLSTQDYLERMTKAYDVDYEQIKSSCIQKMESLSDAKRISIHTGDNCTLHLELTGRKWLLDAGEGDLPCGEIYIAPIEDKTQGSIYFEEFYLEEKRYRCVTLQIENGEVNNSNHEDIAKYFLEQQKENRTVCELGFGMNPNVTSLCGYTVLDEKMSGTFHIAVGANTMFGGNNKATDHIDFVGMGRMEVLT